MAEQSIGINVWLRDVASPALERMQKNFAETAKRAQTSFNSFSTRKFNSEIEQASRRIKDLQGDIALLQKFKNVEIDVKVKDAELKAAEARLKFLTNRPYRITVTIRENWSTWERNFRRSAAALNNQLQQLQNNTSLLGKFLLLAGVAVTPLVTGIMALAGAAAALAGSFTLAAAAVGGAFVAAIAQALPAVGLLVAAFSRVAAVFKSVQAEEKKAGAGADDHTAALDRQRAASQNLIRAQERLGDAYKQLAEARRQAKRDLEDLASAERRVRLEQENSRLAMVGARRSARAALGSGSFLEFEQAQVDLDSAGLAREDANRQGGRAIEDAQRTRAQGVEGNESVIQSQRALRDATWALADAHREVARAQKDQGSAASAAADANKDLTESERDLRDALIELRQVWKDVGRGLTDPIIDSFTFMVKRITALIQDPQILAAARTLSRSIGQGFRTMFSEATTPRQLDNLRFFMRQAAQNVPQIARGIANLMAALANLGRAASPIFARLVSGFVDWTSGLKEATSDQGALNERVAGLAPHLRGWLDLLGSIWGLFKELVSVSNEAGLSLTNSITSKLDEWTQWLRENRAEAKAFFSSASDTARVLGSALASLVAVLGRSTSFEWLQKLAKFFEDVLVPALENAIDIIWVFSGALTTLLGLPVVRDLVQWGVTLAIVGKAVQGLALAFGVLAGPIGLVTKAIGILGIGLKALWLTAFGPYVLVIGGIVVALVLLEKKFGIVTKAINFLRGAAETAINWLKDNWQSVLLVVLTGPFGAIILAFRKWGDDILDFFKSLGGNIGSAIGNGLIGAINTVIDTINGVFDAIRDNWPDIPGVPDPPGFRIPRIGGGSESSSNNSSGGTGGGSFASGGVVPGSGTGDTVPAMLTPGEVVLNKRQQQMIGFGAIRNVLGATGGMIGGRYYNRGGWVYPAPGTTVGGGPGGQGTHSFSVKPNNWQSDMAYDLMGRDGTPVVAAYDGVISGTRPFSSDSRFWGMAAYLDIPEQGQFYYKHLKSLAVRAGQPVTAGQVIGHLGTGVNGGPHLHLGATSRALLDRAMGGRAGSASADHTPDHEIPDHEARQAPQGKRYENRDEFFKRITGYAKNTKGTRFLEKFIDASYADKRVQIPKKTSETLSEVAKTAVKVGGAAAGGTQAKNIALGRRMAAEFGWKGSEWSALHRLWMNESGWRHDADNPTSDAYGIPQAMTNLHNLPDDYRTSPRSQIAWGLDYIKNRYGTPANALAHWNRRVPIGGKDVGHWYETGGEVPGREGEPRSIVAHAGEMILNRGQQMALGGPAFLRKLFKPRGDTGHFATGGEVTSRLNITPREANVDLNQLNSAVRRLQVGRNVKTVNNLVATLNILFEQIEERLTVLQTNVDNARKRIATRAKTRAFAFSGGRAVQLADGFAQLQGELGDVEEERGLVQGQITRTGQSLSSAQTNLRRAQAFARRNPRSAVAERRLQQAEKAVNLFSGQLQDQVGTRADLAAREIGLQRDLSNAGLARGADAVSGIDERISRASSRGQSTTGLLNERLFALNVQALGVNDARNAALSRGDTDFAEELRKQLDSLDSAIVQAQQDKINAAIDDVNKQRSGADRKLDLGERIAKFFGQDISGLIDARIGAIRDQIGGLTAALGQAEASGNTTLADEIRDQIGSLNQDINEQYRRKFSEAREAVDKQFSFASSMNDVALQIAQISGPGFGPNLPAITAALRSRGSLLNSRTLELQKQLSGAYQSGDQDLIRDLTIAVEENKLAILQNNQALAEATGALQDQTWTSTAWEQFRVAIFDGLGGLVPGMSVPALATGGFIKREGLFKLHAGEAVIPAEQVAMGGGDTNVTIYSPGPVLDPIAISDEIGYQLRLRGRK